MDPHRLGREGSPDENQGPMARREMDSEQT